MGIQDDVFDVEECINSTDSDYGKRAWANVVKALWALEEETEAAQKNVAEYKDLVETLVKLYGSKPNEGKTT